MGFLSKIKNNMRKKVSRMPRRPGMIRDMRFRGRMPRRGGFGNLRNLIRRLKEQRDMGMPRMPSMDDGRVYAGGSPGLYKPGGRFYNPEARLQMPQPIPRAEIDISALEPLPMGDMPMTQDLPEVSPVEMMGGRTLQQDFPTQQRMMMAEGDVAEKETVMDFLTKDRRGRKPGNAFSLGKDIYDFVNQPEPSAQMSPEQEIFSLQSQLENLQEQLRLDRSYNDDQAVINTSAEMAAIQRRIQEILQESGRTISDMDRQQIGRTISDMDSGVQFKAEGGEIMTQENEIDAMLGGMDSEVEGAMGSMEDLEQMAPEMEMIDQLVTMVVQMIQQGASEEEVIMFLREQGLDDEDIGTVLQLVAEMSETEAMPQDGIGAELEQLA